MESSSWSLCALMLFALTVLSSSQNHYNLACRLPCRDGDVIAVKPRATV